MKQLRFNIKDKVIFYKKKIKCIGIVEQIDIKHKRLVVSIPQGRLTIKNENVFLFDIDKTLEFIKKKQTNPFS